VRYKLDTTTAAIFEQVGAILKLDSITIAYAKDFYCSYMSTFSSQGKKPSGIIAACIYLLSRNVYRIPPKEKLCEYTIGNYRPHYISEELRLTQGIIAALFKLSEDTVRERTKDLRNYYQQYIAHFSKN
jgi:transcription initiation factor TFIIIB Brf1 subunit/transcription initiation factor TFIIB